MSTVETILNITPETKSVERLRDILVEASKAASETKAAMAGIDPDVLRGFTSLGVGGQAINGQGGSGMTPLAPTPGGTGAGGPGTTPGAYLPGAGPSGNPGDAGGGPRPKPGKPPEPPLWQKILYGGPFEGRKIGGLGALGVGGYMVASGLNAATSAFSSYVGQAATEQAGLVSGSFTGALKGVSSAEFGRQRAENEAKGALGGAFGGGSAMIGGALLAIPGSQIAGLGLVISGALLAAGSQAGTAMGNSLLGVLQAQESAAFEYFGDMFARRKTLSATALSVVAGGGAMPAESDVFSRNGKNVTGLAADFAYTPNEIAQKEAAFSGAGGYGASTRFRLGAERGLGIQSSTVGHYMSALVGGQSTGELAAGADEHLNLVMSNAVTAGLHRAKLPDYLSQIASSNESLALKGANVAAAGLEGNLAGLQTVGFTPMQSVGVNAAVANYSGSLLMGMGEQRLPGEVAQALVKRRLLQKYGSWDAAMAGLEGEIKSGQVMGTLSGIQAGLPKELQAPFGMGITGMFPSLAGKFGEFQPQAGPGGDIVGAALKEVQAMPEFGVSKMAAVEDAIKTLSVTIPEISIQFDTMLELLVTNIDNFRAKFPDAVDRLLTALDGKRRDIKPVTPREQERRNIRNANLMQKATGMGPK